jgi:glutathione-specific gamma-glutamylcyclotransferase
MKAIMPSSLPRVASDMSDFWVFGYGSLMWQPGFDHLEAVPARLIGAHRALCVYSWVHRGTRERPGLVLGLDRGGSCRGMAYRVAGEKRDSVIAYLRERELVTNVYLECWRRISLEGTKRQSGKALTYVVDPTHEQYAGKLSPDALLSLVRGGVGRSGVNADYVIKTAGQIRNLGFRDSILDWLADELTQPD